jgi:hypothetical protein
MYRLLVCHTGIFQTKGHDLLVVDAIGHYECRLVFVVKV